MTDSQSPLDPSTSEIDSPIADLPPAECKPPSNRPSTSLFGPEGLRPGWGFVLYLSLAMALVFIAQKGLAPFTHGLKGTLWPGMVSRVVVMLCAMLPALVMAKLEKRTFGAYGLPARGRFGKKFWYGALWGFAALSLLLVALRLIHVFYFGTIQLHGLRVLKFAVFWGVSFLLVAFFEEFLFRGYTLFTLTRGMGFWPAALALSVLFGAVHLGNHGESWVGAVAAGAIGLFFCLTVRRTGTLWFAVGLHASWDWAESYFYGVPDSGEMVYGHLLNPSSQGPVWLTGGSVGPEGSLLVFAVIAAMFVAFHLLHPQNATAQLTADSSR